MYNSIFDNIFGKEESAFKYERCRSLNDVNAQLANMINYVVGHNVVDATFISDNVQLISKHRLQANFDAFRELGIDPTKWEFPLKYAKYPLDK